jgi:LacI family transcriptional regulator
MANSKSRRKKVGIGDVAKRVGYSPTVVSHALNDYPRINKQTREYIQRVANQMGYRPNVFARSLVTQRSQLIGIVVPGIITSFYPETIMPLKARLEEAGYGLLIMTSEDSDQEEQRAIEFLRERRIDALIVAPHKGAKNASRYDEIVTAGTPVVMIDRWVRSAKCHSVTTDNRSGAELATRHLLEMGHRRITVVKVRSVCSATRERMTGYKRALAAFGVAYDGGLVQSVTYDIGRDLHVDGEGVLEPLLKADRPPTAIFVLHDVLAVGILSAAFRLGLRVPAQLSVVGYDDVDMVKYLPVPLTTVAQDKVAMGQIAAELVVQSLSEPTTAKRDVRLPPRLIVRESTCEALPMAKVG